MKRLYIVLTIVLSSFLLLSGREVKAYTEEISINVDLSIINDDFYSAKSFIDDYILNDTSLSDYYFIWSHNNTFFFNIFCDPSYVPSSYSVSPNYGKFSFTVNSRQFYCTDGVCKQSSSSCSSPVSVTPVYANFPFYLGKSGLDTVNLTINYENEKWTLTTGDVLPSIYDLFLDYNNITPTEPEPEDNTPILTNFYSIVIEKINYLCGVFVSNYIYLAIFVIFLIIILFELIFRRRL